MSIIVELNPQLLEVALDLGQRRHDDSIRKNSKDAHGYTGEPLWANLLGACGEAAVSVVLPLEKWHQEVGRYGAEPDLGEDIQVRTRQIGRPDGYVRPSDHSPDTFKLILVCQLDKVLFKVVGWMYYHEARKYELMALAPGRPDVHFIPQKDFRPIEHFYGRPEDI